MEQSATLYGDGLVIDHLNLVIPFRMFFTDKERKAFIRDKIKIRIFASNNFGLHCVTHIKTKYSEDKAWKYENLFQRFRAIIQHYFLENNKNEYKILLPKNDAIIDNVKYIYSNMHLTFDL